MSSGITACIRNPYDAIKNPKGLISLGTAENQLMVNELTDRMVFNLQPSGLPYGCFEGSEKLRRGIASLWNTRFHLPTQQRITPDNVVVGNGAGSMVSCIAQIVADPGDTFLVPAPVYGAFKWDLATSALVNPVFVLGPDGLPSIEELEEAYEKANPKNPVKALLITNPGNPNGKIIPHGVLESWIRWANAKKIHCVVDEVYALSVWKEGVDFVSSLSFGEEVVDQGLLHVVWSFSKDLCMNGMRVGTIFSRNQDVLKAYKELAYFHTIPSIIDSSLSELLADDAFVNKFIDTNHARLRVNFDRIKTLLNQHAIPFVDPDAAFFMWIDLSKYTRHPSIVAQAQNQNTTPCMVLFKKFLEHGVYVVPGDTFFCAPDGEDAGRFRVNVPVPMELLEEGVRRMVKALDSIS
ncbi:hypothetical protein HDU98_007136 [Podochytrium sp. JEL0797]|nr:hypothetical protein HDU98_007136 [Podochytrium sp. JEL0797]